MATRAIFLPLAAEFPSSNFARPDMVNRRPVLKFDASQDQSCYWTFRAPQGLTGTLLLVVGFIMASATTGNVVAQGQVEAVTTADATDLDATTSFDAVNNSGQVSVPATAGYYKQFTITLTNADSVAAGDYMRISFNRDADSTTATDDAAGDFYYVDGEFRDGA